MNLTPITRRELFSATFRPARASSFLAFGSNQDGTALRPLTVCRVGEAANVAARLQAAGTSPQYMKWNLFGPGVFLEDERADPNAAISDRLQALLGEAKPERQSRLDDTRPRHLLTQAYRLVELGAINIDLDVGTRKDGTRYVDADTALSIVSLMVDKGGLPAPSLVGFSGQGLYILFALIDDSDRLPEATRENRGMFKDAADGLIRRCSSIDRHLVPARLPPTLHPDMTSKNLVQWFKTPDCLHAKTGRPIQYFRYDTSEGEDLRRYRLADLLRWRPAGIDARNQRARQPATWYGSVKYADMFSPGEGYIEIDPPKAKRKYTYREGNTAMPMRRRVEDLERLAQYRKVIPQGKRTLWLMIVFNTWRDVFIRDDHRGDHLAAKRAAQEKTTGFNLRYCVPPLDDSTLRGAVVDRDRRDFRTTTLLRLLKVTHNEVREAGLMFLAPEHMKAKTGYKAKLPTAERAARNEAIFREFKERIPVKVIADKYGLKERQVWRLKKSMLKQTQRRLTLYNHQ